MKNIPKDRQIIIETKYFTTVSIYNPISETFVYANLQVDMFEEILNDVYFENDNVDEDEIINWREL